MLISWNFHLALNCSLYQILILLNCTNTRVSQVLFERHSRCRWRWSQWTVMCLSSQGCTIAVSIASVAPWSSSQSTSDKAPYECEMCRREKCLVRRNKYRRNSDENLCGCENTIRKPSELNLFWMFASSGSEKGLFNGWGSVLQFEGTMWGRELP